MAAPPDVAPGLLVVFRDEPARGWGVRHAPSRRILLVAHTKAEAARALGIVADRLGRRRYWRGERGVPTRALDAALTAVARDNPRLFAVAGRVAERHTCRARRATLGRPPCACRLCRGEAVAP